MDTFVLIRSPLVGPYTWSLVADELRRRGIDVVVPALTNSRANAAEEEPFWKIHAAAVAEAPTLLPNDHAVILVGHSGAGPLLPAIRAGLDHRVSGYMFVDAGLPVHSRSRLDLFESREAVDEFRRNVQSGYLPTWTEADLSEVIPDADVRRHFVEELRPTPLAVYEEPLPVFAAWPDAPCAYLWFSPPYDYAVQQARSRGWPVYEMEAGHFHMLVNPVAVTDALLTLVWQMRLR